MNARYWPCLGVKVFAGGLTPSIRFSCSSVPRTKEARMNVRYRVKLCHAERGPGMRAPPERNGSLDETMDGTIAGEDLDMVAGMNAMDPERRAG
jgi:hypothetical protein